MRVLGSDVKVDVASAGGADGQLGARVCRPSLPGLGGPPLLCKREPDGCPDDVLSASSSRLRVGEDEADPMVGLQDRAELRPVVRKLKRARKRAWSVMKCKKRPPDREERTFRFLVDVPATASLLTVHAYSLKPFRRTAFTIGQMAMIAEAEISSASAARDVIKREPGGGVGVSRSGGDRVKEEESAGDTGVSLFIFCLVAEFLRCQEAAIVCQTNRESAIHSDIQRRLTYRSRRVEFDQDVREAFDGQRAQHAARREAWSCVTLLPINCRLDWPPRGIMIGHIWFNGCGLPYEVHELVMSFRVSPQGHVFDVSYTGVCHDQVGVGMLGPFGLANAAAAVAKLHLYLEGLVQSREFIGTVAVHTFTSFADCISVCMECVARPGLSCVSFFVPLSGFDAASDDEPAHV